MSKKIIKIRAFWIWQAKAETQWLESMAAQGYQLLNAVPFFYIFKKAAPEKVNYCHDYSKVKKNELDNYLQLYRDAGWQYVMRYGNWFYFKSENATQIYSDEHSMALRNASIIKGIVKLAGLEFMIGLLFLGLAFFTNYGFGTGIGMGLIVASIALGLIGLALYYWQKRKLDFDAD